MSDNKRNIDDEYESFMAYLRGETSSLDNDPKQQSSGTDDTDDAFNVIDAVKEFEQFGAQRKTAENIGARPSKSAPVTQTDDDDIFVRMTKQVNASTKTVPSDEYKKHEEPKKPVESGLFAHLDEFDAKRAETEKDAGQVKKYQPQRRRQKYGTEQYTSAVSAEKSDKYMNAWKNIPEERVQKQPVQHLQTTAADEDDGNFISKRKNRRRRSRFKLLKSMVWLVVCIVISVGLAIFLVQSCGDVFGYDAGSEDIQFTIKVSDDISSIAENLSDKGIISQKLTFKFYAKFKEETEGFTPGTYTLNPDMSYDEILALTRQTIAEEKKIVKITFREGLTVYEIADLLAENGVCDKDEFLNTLQNDDLGFDFIDDISDNPLRLQRLEGYLFPDTYDFYVGEKTTSVAKKFLNNFNNKITASMYKKLDERGITLDELVTLASIVQKEAGRAKEMYRVSSVFHNRLNSNGAFPMLQSDTTTNYINDYIKIYGNGDQAMINAYDTYNTSGLPEGPICCPGINALRAALDPAETPYYFFLSDEKGTYYYAETFAGHQNNAAKAAKVGDGGVHGIGIDNGAEE